MFLKFNYSYTESQVHTSLLILYLPYNTKKLPILKYKMHLTFYNFFFLCRYLIILYLIIYRIFTNNE